jgi:hypothetical protein
LVATSYWACVAWGTMKRTSQVFFLTLAYVGLPLLFYTWKYKVIAPIYLFADDTFYYLNVARNSIGKAGFTFDGQFPTNGFHPLWEYFLVALGKFHIVNYASRTTPLVTVLYANVIILALGAAIFCAASTRYLRRPLLAILIAAPGLFWLLSLSVTGPYFSTWSYANGMESSLALFCFSLAFYVYREETRAARTFVFALLLGLAVLSRLDDIFIAATIAAWILLRTPVHGRLRKLLALSPIAILVACYVIYNRLSVGVFLPSSGATKAGLAYMVNLKWSFKLFLPLLTGDPPSVFNGPLANGMFFSLTMRDLQMELPAFLCLVELWFVFRKRPAGVRFNIIHAMAIGVVLKAAYNFMFVGELEQGHWYYTVSVFTASLVMALWLDRLAERLWPGLVLPEGRTWALLGVHGLLVLAAFNLYINSRNRAPAGAAVRLITDPSALVAKLDSLPGRGVIEFDDGLLGYVCGRPAVGGLGLVLDNEANRALKHGSFLHLMYQRGFRVAVSDANYANELDAAVQARKRGEDASVFKLQPAELRQFSLQPLGGDGSADGVRFYQLIPVLEN